MAERSAKIKFLYEGAAARYRALMVKSSDPARRSMLAEMIARELQAAKHRELVVAPMTRKRSGNAETA